MNPFRVAVAIRRAKQFGLFKIASMKGVGSNRPINDLMLWPKILHNWLVTLINMIYLVKFVSNNWYIDDYYIKIFHTILLKFYNMPKANQSNRIYLFSWKFGPIKDGNGQDTRWIFLYPHPYPFSKLIHILIPIPISTKCSKIIPIPIPTGFYRYAGFIRVDICQIFFYQYYTHVLAMCITSAIAWLPGWLLIGWLLGSCHRDERDREDWWLARE